MRLFRAIRQRLHLFGKYRAMTDEIDEELRFHIEERTAEKMAGGMTPNDAAREARKRFGNLQSVREECRETGGSNFGDMTWKDVRFGFRMLRRNPGFAAIAVLTLALGIGATSAVYCLIQSVLLTPPPYPDPGQVALIQPARLDGEPYARACTESQWMEWRNATNSFRAVAGYEWRFNFLIREDGSESAQGLRVTPEYFKVIGVKPLLGREFSQTDIVADREGETTMILGYDFWQRQFHGDSNILGQVIHLSRRPPQTVVGVMPPGVRFLPSPDNAAEPNYNENGKVDYLAPFWLPDPSKPDAEYCNMAGRLRNGATIAQAQAELAMIAGRQAGANASYQGLTAKVEPLMAERNRNGRRLLLTMMGAVTLVFLIACANVAGLLLTRGLQRQEEYSLRCALGAQRAELFRQVLTESLLVALSGGALGMGLAAGILKMLEAIGGHAIPRLDAVALGWHIPASCLGAAIVATLAAGLAPAFHAARSNLTERLKGARASSLGQTERRWLGSIVTVQIALTLALLMGAGLLIRTMVNLANVQPGYATQNILTMDVTHPDINGKWLDFDAEALERIAALPGVQHVAFGWGVPLTGNHWMNAIRLDGQSDAKAGTAADFKNEVAVATRTVTEDYFDALGLKVVSGREFRLSDRWYGSSGNTNAPFVAVVNQAMANKNFRGRDPVGAKILFPGNPKPPEIIGVVADSRDNSLVQQAEPEVFFYYFQMPAFTKRLVVRTSSDSRQAIAEVQRELRAIDPAVAVEHVKTLEQIRDESFASQTFAMRLVAGFALVGCALALVGVYGVLSLSVAARRREIAVRMAVGAQRRNILTLILSEGLKLIVVGLVIGTGIALLLGRLLQVFLFGVQPADPSTFISVVILFTAVALLECFIPARRATQVDPMTALRCE